MFIKFGFCKVFWVLLLMRLLCANLMNMCLHIPVFMCLITVFRYVLSATLFVYHFSLHIMAVTK